MQRPNVAMLSEIPLFALLGDAERATLAELLEAVRYRKGETIFTTGEPGNSMLIIRSGRVRIVLEDDRGQRIVLGEGGPGEMIGEVSLLDGGPRTATVVALTDLAALSLDRDDLLELVTLRPTAALGLMTVMGQRQRANSGLLRSQGSRNVNDEEKVRLSFAHRVAGRAAGVFGSWTFLLIATVALVGAFCAPIWDADHKPFEVVVVALLGLIFLQTSVILIAMNRQAAKDRIRANLEYQLDLKTELGVSRIEESLERLGTQVRSLISGSQADGALGRSPRPPAV